MERVSSAAEELHRAHGNVERLLLVLEAHVVLALKNEEADDALMRSIVDYVMDYLDRLHDPREKAAFEALAERAPWLRALLDAHASELDLVRASGKQLSEAIARKALGREHLAFVAALRRHITTEEVELLPAIASLESAGGAPHEPSAHGAEVEDREARFRRLFEELTHEAGCDCDYE